MDAYITESTKLCQVLFYMLQRYHCQCRRGDTTRLSLSLPIANLGRLVGRLVAVGLAICVQYRLDDYCRLKLQQENRKNIDIIHSQPYSDTCHNAYQYKQLVLSKRVHLSFHKAFKEFPGGDTVPGIPHKVPGNHGHFVCHETKVSDELKRVFGK
jgi:hypothetical protein